jgi:hypothetical protein
VKANDLRLIAVPEVDEVIVKVRRPLVILLAFVWALATLLVSGLSANAQVSSPWSASAGFVNEDGTVTVVIPARPVPGFTGVNPNHIDLSTGLQIGTPILTVPAPPSP